MISVRKMEGIKMKNLNALNCTVKVDGLELAKKCSENVLASIKQLEDSIDELSEGKLTIRIDAEDKQEDDFGLEDIEGIIADLQESYYKLNRGSIQLKIAISQEIRELVMLKINLERSCTFL